MKKSYITLLGLAAFLTLTACGKTESVSAPSKPVIESNSSAAAITASPPESVVSSAVESVTFSEKDYDELCQNIKIGERTLEFPCTVKDLAPDLIVAQDEPHVTGNDLAAYKLKYNGVLSGEVKIRYGEGDDPDNLDTLEKNKIAELTVYLLDIGGTEGLKNGFSIGDIDFDTAEGELKSRFGEPDKALDFGTSREMRYLAGNGKAVVFRAEISGTVRRITLTEAWAQ